MLSKIDFLSVEANRGLDDNGPLGCFVQIDTLVAGFASAQTYPSIPSILLLGGKPKIFFSVIESVAVNVVNVLLVCRTHNGLV